MGYGDRKPYITAKGYVRLYAPEHPLANKWGHVFEHRMVAWDNGIITEPQQIVHHISGDKTDNRPENLRGMSGSAHSAHHAGQKNSRTREEYLQSERDRYRRRANWVACEACGREFGWDGSQPQGCGNTCRAALRRAAGWRPRYMRTCEVCGREFRCRVGEGRVCSPTCRAALP